MNVTYQIEPASTDRLLTCLDLAIEEAKLVKSIIETKGITDNLEIVKPRSKRLMSLDRDIDYLEKKLAEVRNQASIRLID